MNVLSIGIAAFGAAAMLAGSPAASDTDRAGIRAGEFVVVVNSENPATSIARDRLSGILLKRIATWPDGKPAEPVDLPAGDHVRVAFTKSVHGKSVGAVRAFWQQQIFSGRDVPPPEKANEADVLEFVGKHAGAVGYVSATMTLGANVKAIAVDGT